MTKLEAVGDKQLRAALETAETARATKRLIVALAYKDGVHVQTIASRYGIPQSTIYYWLDLFEQQPLDQALAVESRPGRPPKISAEERAIVNEWLGTPPEEHGIDADAWTAEHLQEQISSRFDVEYSIPHLKRTFLE